MLLSPEIGAGEVEEARRPATSQSCRSVGSSDRPTRGQDESSHRFPSKDRERSDADHSPLRMPDLERGKSIHRSHRDANATYKHLARVSGRIIEAKNLNSCGKWAKSDPYLVIKGIRSSSHLVHVFKTKRLDNEQNPAWDEEFEFTCPQSWGYNQLVGLKFFIYHANGKMVSDCGSDYFLGGADLDLYDAPSSLGVTHTLELGGNESVSAQGTDKGSRRSRSMLWVMIQVQHEYLMKPPSPDQIISRSLLSYHRVSRVDVKIAKAKYLSNSDAIGLSDPACVVRLALLSGRVVEVNRTTVQHNTLNPVWEHNFQLDFEELGNPADQPLVLIFDVFDWVSGLSDITKGTHLGSAFANLWDFPTDIWRKRKLELVGESQLLERKLQKDGKLASGVTYLKGPSPAARRSGSSRDLDQGGRTGIIGQLAKLVVTVKNMKVQPMAPVLLIEANVSRTEEVMPFSRLVKQPIEVREEEDIEAIAKMPDWTRTHFKLPAALGEDIEAGGRPRLGTLRAKDKIVFVTGVVKGASGLAVSDIFSKSDPYCIVEGQTAGGTSVFIYRTRVVNDKCSPSWNEAFFFAVPEKVTLQSLSFSIHDWDSDAMKYIEGRSAGDELLGQMCIDLSYLCNGESMLEEIPLFGCKVKPVPKKPGGVVFRRNPTLSVDIRVERRVFPLYDVRREQISWEARGRHQVSRPPPINRIFQDPGQKRLIRPPCEEIGLKVLNLYHANKLVGLYKKDCRVHLQEGHWRRPTDVGAFRHPLITMPEKDDTPAIRNNPDDFTEDDPLEERRRLMGLVPSDALHELAGAVRSGRPTMSKAASVPAMHTRFGRHDCPQARQFESLRPPWVDELCFLSSARQVSAKQALSRKPLLPAEP